MTEPVEIGVFAAAGPGEILGEPLYVQKHDIRSGTQTISVIVPNEPARGASIPTICSTGRTEITLKG